MTKAFAYLRVSGKGQVEGDGFTRQRTAIKAYVAANNIRIVKEFREEGVSGAVENMNRPAWSAMLTALHADGVRTIIVEKLDRLARDLMIQETAIADLRKYGFTLLSVAEPDLMATDATRILIRQVLGAVSQYDKSQIVSKLRGSRLRKRAQTGRCEGRKPYGFYEGESAILTRIKALRSEGSSFEAIAKTLDEENVLSRTGRKWRATTVHKILTRVV